MLGSFDGNPQTAGSTLQRYLRRYRELTGEYASDQVIANALELRRVDAVVKSVFENSFDAIAIFGQDGLIEGANRRLAQMIAVPPAALPGSPFASLFADGTEAIHRTLQSGAPPSGYFEAIGTRSDGSLFPVEIAIAPAQFSNDRRYIAIVRDISERKAQQDRLEHQALHDALTHLPNRILFNDRLEYAMSMSRRSGKLVAVVLLDLNRFKEVNDTLGHDVGDQLLRDVSQRLRNCVRQSDTVGRLGGDEFAVLFASVDDETIAYELTLRLTDALIKPFTLNGLLVEIGVSAGIALYPRHAEQKEKLLQFADVAMYAAKREHSRVTVYDPAIDNHSIKNLTLAGALRSAIDQRRILMKYQPKLDLRTNAIVGYEALARWNHDEHGAISPSQFVIEAERTGLIRPLTLLTLDMALDQAARWWQCERDVSVAVNLSTRSLQDEALPSLLARALAKWQAPPDAVTLEITESALMADPTRALKVAEEIAMLGLKLAIDDFGTGYSSLAYLSGLPVSELKIDKSFVMRMLERERDARIVQSTIDLGHNLGLKVVAEGVETPEVLARLRELGCDIAQGYLIGKPQAMQKPHRAGKDPANSSELDRKMLP